MMTLVARLFWASETHPLRLDAAPYRPHLRLAGHSDLLGVEFTRGPVEIHPGDQVTVEIVSLFQGVDDSGLEPGARFEVVEGGRHVVGVGEVLTVVEDVR